jgi:hypothetical protein
VGGQRHARPLYPPGKRRSTQCLGGLVGPKKSLDGCRKSHPHRDSISGPSSPSYQQCQRQQFFSLRAVSRDFTSLLHVTWLLLLCKRIEQPILVVPSPLISGHVCLRTNVFGTFVTSVPIHWAGARNFLKIISACCIVWCLLYEAPRQSDTVPHRATLRYIANYSVEARHTIPRSRMVSF